MYFKSVKSPLKRGVDVCLGPRTLLVGPNGAGKTSVIQALELATKGMVSELEGRDDVKLGRSIGRLFGPDEEQWAEVITDTGLRFVWNPKDHVQPAPVRWPIQELTAVLKGEESKIRTWLEGQVGSNMTLEDVLSMVDDSVHDVIKRLARRGTIDLLELAKAAKDEAKNLRTTATRTEKTIDKMVSGIAPPMLKNERSQYEQQAALEVKGLSKAEHIRLVASLDALMGDYDELERRLENIPKPEPWAASALSQARAIRNLLAANRAIQPTECWVCNAPGFNQALKEKEVESTISELLKLCPDDTLASAAQFELSRLKTQILDLDRQLQAPVVDTDARDRARQVLAADDVSVKAWANADAERSKCAKFRAIADHLSDAAKQLETKGLLRLKHQKAAFEAKASKFLPTGEALGVDLEAARVGFIRGAELHSALSGSELTRALLALATASEDGSTLSVLAPGDRSWDSVTLGHVMRALSDAPNQIILMSTVLPDSKIPGWTILELG